MSIPERNGRFSYVGTVHYQNADSDGPLCGRYSVMNWSNHVAPSEPVNCKACLRMMQKKPGGMK